MNINTASAEVLAARLPQLSHSDISVLVAHRRTASFRDLHEVATYLPAAPNPDPALLSVATHYFLINGHITLQQAALQVQGLVERSGSATYLLWLRES